MERNQIKKLCQLSPTDRKIRRQKILSEYYSGDTPPEIGNRWGISAQAVYHILRQESYTPKFFGRRDKVSVNRENKIRKLQAMFSQLPENDLPEFLQKVSSIVKDL